MSIISCDKKHGDNFIESFEKTKNILVSSEPVVLQKSNLFFSTMFSMTVVNNLLFVNEIKDPEYNMKIVNLKTGSIKNFAKRGRGPNEVSSRGVDFSVDYENNKVFLIDGLKGLSYSTILR